jgi:hypothetical protein
MLEQTRIKVSEVLKRGHSLNAEFRLNQFGVSRRETGKKGRELGFKILKTKVL